MDADSLVNAALESVPGARVSALVDLSTGMFLTVQPVPDDPSGYDLLAASVREIFEGEMSEGLRQGVQEATDQTLDDVVISGPGVVHVMTRMRSQPDLVLTVSCPSTGNLGMALVKVRRLASSMEVEGV